MGALKEIPRLVTDRLLLRAHEVQDFGACAAMWGDPEVVRHISGMPSTAQQTWSRMLTYAGLWRLLGYGYWALVERASGAFAGDVGFADFKREMTPSIAGLPEAGWVLARAMHGKGYASEAVAAMVAWADEHIDAVRSVCIVDPRHSASIRVADKNGYRAIASADYRGPVTLFERQRRR
ncbi:MAG: GNAT family N-acetyltransferase [Candidatus Eremiobacteraeota bacterium]|nr:GNAT family N-acetyltransferase [Candidatus Eremiobacteraeota bacterium]MBC5827949.1 GNAT family N-acetyltransferase [Candidatus Eremiobacteraeota bacterium]